jgi:hypothetical protein
LYWGRAISLHSECTHRCLHMAAATAAILHGLKTRLPQVTSDPTGALRRATRLSFETHWQYLVRA